MALRDSKTFSYNFSHTIQCFTTNKSGTKAIVAGKQRYELFDIEESQFTHKARHDLAFKLFCLMDICWSKCDEQLVVSGGSNGALYKLLVRESELVHPDNHIKYHDKTINKINFHPTSNQLISGSQDGLIKLIDFRDPKSAVKTFHHNPDDKVTDCQFNPSPSRDKQFASGSENGFTYIWDIRKPKEAERVFSNHIGSVHIDYHPEQYWLATAAINKQICVYDLDNALKTDPNKEKAIHTLTHSDSVTSIQWRPNKPLQLTACSSGIDAHLFVWDLNRPYVPYASFDNLTNKAQDFMWKANDPNILIASTPQQLWHYHINDAIRPVDHATLCTIQMDKNGSIAFAVGVNENSRHSVEPAFSQPGGTNMTGSNTINMTNNTSAYNITGLYRDSLTLNATENNNKTTINEYGESSSINESVNDSTTENDNIGSYMQRGNQSNFENQVAGSYSSLSLHNNKQLGNSTLCKGDHISTDSNNNFENFRMSTLHFDDQIEQTRSDWFVYAAKNYMFKDKGFEELCEHNAQIALNYHRFSTHKDWMIMKTIFTDITQKYDNQPTSYRQQPPPSFSIHPPATNTTNMITTSNSSNSNQAANRLAPTTEIDTSISKLKINVPPSGAFVSIPSSNLLTINASTSSSSSSSAPTSSSLNDNSTRIRHFSENDSNEATGLLLTGSAMNANSFSKPTMSTSFEKKTKFNVGDSQNISQQQKYFSNNNLLSALHSDQNYVDMDMDYPMWINNQNKFEDEEDISTLPIDAIEYNDELSNDCFVNTKFSKSGGHSQSRKNSHRQNLLKDENQALNFLRSDIKQQNKLSVDGSLNHQPNTSSTSNNATVTNANNFLLQAVDSDSNNNLNRRDDKPAGSTTDDNFLKNLLTQGDTSALSKMDFGNYFQQLLWNYVNVDNDLPTAIFMYQVMHETGKLEQVKLESKREELDEWFAQYIELLAMFELWNLRIQIIKSYRSERIIDFNNLTRKSIVYEPMCATCKKTIKQNTFACPSCNKNVFLCSYCHHPVRRLYMWCFSCCHGGHLRHMMKWFKNNTQCPSGCGCSCRFA